MRDANRELLLSAARLLRPMLEELVFVGGCATGLLMTDDAAAGIRATIDVDAIAEITSYPEYIAFSARLRKVGFTQDTSEGAPLCRWVHAGVILDVMPLDPKILGFSNRWYKEAMIAAELRTLEPSLQIRSITAPFFLATKLEAFKGRGRRDYFGSHDLEDVLSVIDARPELLDEVRAAPDDLRAYLALEFRALLQDPRFLDALPGHLLPDAASQARIPLLLHRIEELTKR
jgi:predicted nucleotidyltransferase